MHGLLRMIAMLLLLGLAAAWAEAQAMPFVVAPSRHAGGCHEHEPATPAPASTHHQCCVNGHDAAVPSVLFSLRSAAAQVASFDDGGDLGFGLLLGMKPAEFVFPSVSPPGAARLRI